MTKDEAVAHLNGIKDSHVTRKDTREAIDIVLAALAAERKRVSDAVAKVEAEARQHCHPYYPDCYVSTVLDALKTELGDTTK